MCEQRQDDVTMEMCKIQKHSLYCISYLRQEGCVLPSVCLFVCLSACLSVNKFT